MPVHSWLIYGFSRVVHLRINLSIAGNCGFSTAPTSSLNRILQFLAAALRPFFTIYLPACQTNEYRGEEHDNLVFPTNCQQRSRFFCALPTWYCGNCVGKVKVVSTFRSYLRNKIVFNLDLSFYEHCGIFD